MLFSLTPMSLFLLRPSQRFPKDIPLIKQALSPNLSCKYSQSNLCMIFPKISFPPYHFVRTHGELQVPKPQSDVIFYGSPKLCNPKP